MNLPTILKYPMLKSLGVALLFATASFPRASSAQTVITFVPYVISSPGLYVLNGSLNYFGASLNPAAIMVNTGNVTIDLQGFYISNLSVGPATAAIGIEWVNRPNVTVRNGSIQGFSQGIHAENGGGSNLTSALIENVRFVYITNFAMVLAGSRNAIVRNCQISSTGYDSTNSVIPGANGIAIFDVNSAGGNLISGNSISSATGTGIALGSNDLADGNSVTNTPFGIQCNDASGKLKNNTVSLSTTPYTGGTQLPGTNF
jgi:hypothetical protein